MMSIEYRCHFCASDMELTGDCCCDNKNLTVGKCVSCGLVQQTDFSHVNTEYYKSESYVHEDVDQVRNRERSWNKKRLCKLQDILPNIKNKNALDFGCGPGGFLEVAHSAFKNLYGFDLNTEYCKMHNQVGWECYDSLELVPNNVNIVTLFHVLEHVKEPWILLKDLEERLPECEYFVIEVPNTEEALNSVFECQSYRANHYSSEHLYYFSYNSLQQVVEDAGLECMLQTGFQRYSLANNLGWLAQGKRGGQFHYTIFNDQDLSVQYEKVLVQSKIADSILFFCRPKNINSVMNTVD